MRFENECECGCLGADDIIEWLGDAWLAQRAVSLIPLLP